MNIDPVSADTQKWKFRPNGIWLTNDLRPPFDTSIFSLSSDATLQRLYRYIKWLYTPAVGSLVCAGSSRWRHRTAQACRAQRSQVRTALEKMNQGCSRNISHYHWLLLLESQGSKACCRLKPFLHTYVCF